MAEREVNFLIKAKDATAAAFASLSRRLRGMDGDFARLGRGINSVKGHMIALAGALSVGAFAGVVREQLEYAASLSDSSQKTGIAVQDLQLLQAAAENSGSSADQMTESLTNMNKALAKAKAGDTKSNNLLKDLGIDPATVKDAKDMLLQVSESFKNAGGSAEEMQKKTALLAQLKIDPSFIQTLEQGSQAIVDLGQMAQDTGLIISEDVVNSLADLDNKLKNLEKQAQVSGTIFTSGLAPALGNVAEAFLSAGKGGDFLRQAGIFVGDAIKGVIIVLAAGGTALYAFAKAGLNAGDFVITKFRQVLVIMTSVSRALMAVVEAGSFNPVTMAKAAAKSISDSQAEVERIGNESNQRIKDRKAEIQEAFVSNANFSGKLLEPNYKDTAAKDSDEKKLLKALGNSSLSKGGGGGKSGGGGDDKGIDKARAAVVKAEADADAKIRTAAEKKHQDDIKDLLDDGEISYANYYATLAESQQKVIDIRLEALRIEAGEQEKLMASKGTKESEKLAAQAKLKTITGDIKVLEMERGEIAGKAARDQKKDERDLANTLQDVTIQTKTLLDTLDDDDRLKVIQSKYEDMLKKVKSNGGEAQVRDLMKRELSKANADASLDKIGRAETTLGSRTRAINADTGMSSIEKRSAITTANREAQAAIEAMLPALREQSREFPEYANKVRDAESALADLKVAADEVGSKLNEEIQGGLADALYNIGTGAKSPAEAFKDLFAGVGKSIAKQVSDDIASSFYTYMKSSGFNPGALISDLMSSGKSSSSGSSGGGSSGIASVFDAVKGFFGFETGGYTGSGGTTAPAGIVHGQEFVLSAPAVRAIGVPFLNDFHQRLRSGAPKSPISGFANGGFFAGNSRSGNNGGGGAPVTNFNITTPNAQSFIEAQGRINAKAAAAAQRAKQRNM